MISEAGFSGATAVYRAARIYNYGTHVEGSDIGTPPQGTLLLLVRHCEQTHGMVWTSDSVCIADASTLRYQHLQNRRTRSILSYVHVGGFQELVV
jgi:hypothetical protein